MAEFYKGNDLNSKLDKILEGAEQKLYLISPFIKFHARVKEILNTKKSLDTLQIIVVFGKNEYKKEKSFGKEAFEYLAQFPNVEIKYEQRLHAKYYANEKATLLSSMNLYEYSQNNNIEFGIYTEANNLLENLWNSKSVEADAWEYFNGIVKTAEVVYKKKPIYEDKLLGLKKKYVGSEVVVDKSNEIFKADKVAPKKVEKSETTIQPEEKLLSATALGKTAKKSYKQVIDIMSSKGYINEDSITAEGKKQGLDYKSNAKGDSWIVYPESIKDIL